MNPRCRLGSRTKHRELAARQFAEHGSRNNAACQIFSAEKQHLKFIGHAYTRNVHFSLCPRFGEASFSRQYKK
jgi:hypothetical protein